MIDFWVVVSTGQHFPKGHRHCRPDAFINCLLALTLTLSSYGPQMGSIMNTRLLVSVIDDDESVRESLPHLLKGFGFAVRAFSSAEEFMASDQISQSKCLVVDINMPGMSGPDLLEELKRLGRETPVIFITAHRDEKVRSHVIERGAIACLFKPFSGNVLRAAIDSALENG